MSVALWRIATDTPSYVAEDLRGEGAKATGGRWNSVGRAALYTAPAIALACLETAVHLATPGLPLNRFLVRILVPEEVWATRTIRGVQDLPVGWQSTPPGRVSIQHGDLWLQSGVSALLQVPSVIVPEEFNIVVNPSHLDAARMTAAKVRQWVYDGRLIGMRRP